MNRSQLFANFLLLLTALIWGCAFVAQSIGMNYVEPFTFTATRSFLGCFALTPVVFYFTHYNKTHSVPAPKGTKKDLIIASLLAGLFLCIGTNLQQIGLLYTTAGKAGFITALYIVLVPIMGIFLKQRIGLSVWISVAISTIGLYLLCMTESLSLNTGDLCVFFCAFAFTGQILVIDYYTDKVDCIRLAQNQLLVSAIISAFLMLIFETPSLTNILQAWAPILYAGILSSAVGYTLQIFAQKRTAPTVASLLMSLESVFAAIAGFFILHEILTARELFGCILMFTSIILAQLPTKKRS